MTGDLLYELAALHLDLFAGDPRLLAAFLDAYGLPAAQRADLPRKALATALLHRSTCLPGCPPRYCKPKRWKSWPKTFGELLWILAGRAREAGLPFRDPRFQHHLHALDHLFSRYLF